MEIDRYWQILLCFAYGGQLKRVLLFFVEKARMYVIFVLAYFIKSVVMPAVLGIALGQKVKSQKVTNIGF